MENTHLHPEETGLADELNQFQQLHQATTTQRFFNFLIDNLFMNYALSYLTGYLYGYLLEAIAPDFLYQIAQDGETGWRYILLLYTLGYFNYIIYYTFCEAAFKGYTLGKLIIGTRAVRTDGTNLSLKDAFLRSLSRVVPLEAFSAFGGNPWHDTWTKTTVVKSR